MNKTIIGLGLSSLLALTACSDKETKVENPISCSNPAASKSILDSVLKKAKQSTLALNKEGWTITEATIDQVLSQVQIKIDSIRTDNQTDKKATCLATYTIDVPTTVLSRAQEGFGFWSEGGSSLVGNLEELNWTKDAASLKKNIQFTVQQTDDGKEVITDLDKSIEVSDGLSSLLIGYAAQEINAKMMAADDQNEKEYQEREAKLQALDDERTIAMVKEAKELNKFAHQNMNQAWQALPAAVRNELKGVQNAWNEKRQKDCRYNATASTDNTPSQALIVVKCDTDYVDNRTAELREIAGRYVNNEAADVENRLSSLKSQMNQTWGSLPKEVRETLQQEQKEWQNDTQSTCTSKRSQTADQDASQLIFNRCMAEEIKKRIANLKKFQV